MNLRGNKPLMIGGGICVAVLLAELVLVGVSALRLSSSKNEWSKVDRERNRLLTRNPFPSAENVQITMDNLDALEYQAGELAGELNKDPFPMGDIEAAEFSARTQDVIERFRDKAAAAGIALPSQAEVGFSRYASGGIVPKSVIVPRLTRQLYSAERVANVLVESGVSSISAMSRDLFEEASPQEVRRRRPKEQQNVSMPVPGGAASEVGEGRLYYVERINVTFTADEKGVWRVLEGFAKAPHFMTVASFGHQTKSDILSYSPTAVKGGSNSDDETLKYLAGGILTGESALSRPERIIAGNELVEVQLEVDVYNFNLEGLPQ